MNEPGTKWEYGISERPRPRPRPRPRTDHHAAALILAGMDWAGIVLERASGMKLGEWCQSGSCAVMSFVSVSAQEPISDLAEHIFEPLGLVDSAFDLAGQDELLARASVLHQWDAEKGTSQPREHARR